MKYQKILDLEAKWKWQYLIKKSRIGEKITRYVDLKADNDCIKKLELIENYPQLIDAWIEMHIDLVLDKKLKQAIRAKRKRHFNARDQYARKKSIDLDFAVWQKLSKKSEELEATLSETIDYLISESDKSHLTVKNIKADLEDLLKL